MNSIFAALGASVVSALIANGVMVYTFHKLLDSPLASRPALIRRFRRIGYAIALLCTGPMIVTVPMVATADNNPMIVNVVALTATLGAGIGLVLAIAPKGQAYLMKGY